jgi:hypothetical protein
MSMCESNGACGREHGVAPLLPDASHDGIRPAFVSLVVALYLSDPRCDQVYYPDCVESALADVAEATLANGLMVFKEWCIAKNGTVNLGEIEFDSEVAHTRQKAIDLMHNANLALVGFAAGILFATAVAIANSDKKRKRETEYQQLGVAPHGENLSDESDQG